MLTVKIVVLAWAGMGSDNNVSNLPRWLCLTSQVIAISNPIGQLRSPDDVGSMSKSLGQLGICKRDMAELRCNSADPYVFVIG